MSDSQPPSSDDKSSTIPKMSPVPHFAELLRDPIVKEPALPSNFKIEIEATHLLRLWEQCAQLREYDIQAFVYAGGSGMVFKARQNDSPTLQALKIARHHLFDKTGLPPEAAQSLSPVSPSELDALKELFHPNVVRLFSTVTMGDNTMVAIGTTYVDDPLNIDEYLRYILDLAPLKGHAFSPERLDNACGFLIERAQEIASALAHMHNKGIYHFDLKPANILISRRFPRAAMLTDMGSCINTGHYKPEDNIRVHFTWTYAHPKLHDIIHNPASISGGGLKASASVSNVELAKYDVYALGRTLQQALAVIDNVFGRRCYASYSFRFLHLIACMLLDGHNAPITDPEKTRISRDGIEFVSDTAMQYPVRLFDRHRIRSAGELEDRLRRHSRDYSWNTSVPELDPWQADVINTGVDRAAPFTKRVAAIFNHPAMRRLKAEAQLGWMREVYTSATHTRWSHALGTLESLVIMYRSLIADPEVPTFRVLVDAGDIEHAMLASILHDVGQTAFGHDFESVSTFPKHETYTADLLSEDLWGSTLEQTIKEHWPNIDLDRVLYDILRIDRPQGQTAAKEQRFVDGIATDSINGPIDADKLDYLLRDSINCGVPYGLGMDRDRLVRRLSGIPLKVSDSRTV